jgi:membrane-associated phospholipid phosphatase
VTIYGITNYLSQHHLYNLKFHTDLELSIPLIPEFIFIYFSLNLLTILPVFWVDEKGLYSLNRVMTFCTITAGLIFLFLPATCGYERVLVKGYLEPFYKNLYSIDFNGNTFPSLHITFAYIFSRILTLYKKKLKWLFFIWFIAISLSVVFTHQHHILDIIGGIILGEIGLRKYYEK